MKISSMVSVNRLLGFLLILFSMFSLSTRKPEQGNEKNAVVKIDIYPELAKYTINRNIYGHFSEHLGHCIYGGLWVGENSTIPNVRGIRTDVIEALKKIHIPLLRWPGGCFADTYHWKDGIGPKENRPKMVNVTWGGVVEDNSFGTHEFMDFCELIGAQPYFSANIGSGTVEEMAKWVEYLTFDGLSPMSELRRKNGQDKPWKVSYWGIGNEAWGCGGNMTPDYYVNEYRKYVTYLHDYGDNKLFKIAAGAGSWDLNWTDVLMKNIPLWMIDGISIHHYTVPGNWNVKGSATEFTEEEYFTTMQKCIEVEKYIISHSTIMDKYDPDKKVALAVDEWGAWYDVEPGTNPAFLYQQNTLRDALVAATSLNIFNNHCDRVRMANIAQLINVLQSVILTNNEKMIVTPTYHVFDMYQVHQDAIMLPVNFKSPVYEINGQKINAINLSASKDKSGKIHITIVNLDPKNDIPINFEISGIENVSVGKADILTAKALNAHNTFEQPDNVVIQKFSNYKTEKGQININLPAMSIVSLEID